MPKVDFPDDAVFIQPPNTLLRIDALYAFVSVDKEGNEGLCAAPMPGSNTFTMPMIAADEARLSSLIPYAMALAERSGMTIKLIKLERRVELRTFEP